MLADNTEVCVCVCFAYKYAMLVADMCASTPSHPLNNVRPLRRFRWIKPSHDDFNRYTKLTPRLHIYTYTLSRKTTLSMRQSTRVDAVAVFVNIRNWRQLKSRECVRLLSLVNGNVSLLCLRAGFRFSFAVRYCEYTAKHNRVEGVEIDHRNEWAIRVTAKIPAGKSFVWWQRDGWQIYIYQQTSHWA